jgi:hypothetical protein
LAVKTRARVRTHAQWVNHVKTAEAVALHNVMRQLLRQVSVQHSLKNQETREPSVTHAHRQVALATARCAEVAKTRAAIGHLKVVPTASHVMVLLVLRLVHLVEIVRLVMTVLLVVILDLIVRLVHSVTAMRVRHVMTVLLVVTSVRVMTVRPVMTVLLVVISDLIVRLVHSTAILVRHVVTLVQTVRLVHSVPTAMGAVRIA